MAQEKAAHSILTHTRFGKLPELRGIVPQDLHNPFGEGGLENPFRPPCPAFSRVTFLNRAILVSLFTRRGGREL